MRFGIFYDHHLPRASAKLDPVTRCVAALAVVLTLAACGGVTSAGVPRPAPRINAASAAVAVQSTNALALDLLRRLGAASANTVFSPYSIQAALAMVDAGAAGETASQIGRTLHAQSAPSLETGNAALTTRLAAATAQPRGAPAHDLADLHLANGLWIQSGLSLMPPFVRTLAQDFGAAPASVDFQRQPGPARRAINDWVAAHTAKLITNLMPPGSITVQTAMVLANAIYLKAHWSSPFDPSATSPGTFFATARVRVRAPFMTQPPTLLSYARGAGYQAVDLPYRSSTLSMLVVMPSPGTLERFEQRLSVPSLTGLEKSLAPRLVDLRMPRFHLVLHAELSQALAALGMPLAFGDRADFSGITAQAPLKIAAVEHGADLKVDEFGTVAAAATGISLTPTAVAPSPVTRLTLDHPFLLFLRDDVTGAVLFAGRVADPTGT